MRLILLFLFAFYCAPMVGQESLDSTPIDTIVVSENNALSSLRPEPSYSWSYIPALPSAMGSRPVDDLLNQSTAQLFVKNYGAGSLSSLTSKGLAAEHQEIEWNGLQINSAMNGIIDLKLLPTIMSDKISWHESGDFTAGSKLSLSNRVPKALGVETELNIEAGSFGQRSTHVSVANNFPRLYLRMQLMAHVAENDFNFTNIALANDPVQKLEHARTNGSGAQVSARYKIKRRKYLDFNGWYQQNERQIPRTMLQTESVAEQDDRQWRQVLSWKNDRWTASSGWQWEEILFRDEKINIDAENRAHTWSHKLKYRSFELPGREYDKYYFLESEISHIYSLGKADNYGDNRVDQSKTAIRFRLQKVKRKKTALSLDVNGMLFNRKFYFLPKLDFSKNLFNSMALTKFSHHIELSAGRHFRAPNLNDLYWEPGGNPELAAETGYKADVRYSVRMSRNNNFARGFLLRINPYFRNINNRILWLPSDAFWSPQQAGKVESMGIDISSSYENSFRKKHEFNWKAYANYSYSHSIVKESIIPNDASVGKQLIYTPMHRWTAGVSLTNNKWGLDYRHQLTGKYYLTTVNSQEQASYQTGDLSISYSIQKKTNFTIMLNAYNIWNEQYQVLPWRPMPGRNFRISLQLSKNNSKKKN